MVFHLYASQECATERKKDQGGRCCPSDLHLPDEHEGIAAG